MITALQSTSLICEKIKCFRLHCSKGLGQGQRACHPMRTVQWRLLERSRFLGACHLWSSQCWAAAGCPLGGWVSIQAPWQPAPSQPSALPKQQATRGLGEEAHQGLCFIRVNRGDTGSAWSAQRRTATWPLASADTDPCRQPAQPQLPRVSARPWWLRCLHAGLAAACTQHQSSSMGLLSSWLSSASCSEEPMRLLRRFPSRPP